MKDTNKQTLSQVVRAIREAEGNLSVKDLLPKVLQVIQERKLPLQPNYRKVYRAVREEDKKISNKKMAVPYEL